MKRFIIGFGWLVAASVAIAGTGTSNEFRVDTRTGVRMAAATEKIQYSTVWATNLTAAQRGEAKALVKVNPCLKTPPKYLVVDMSGGRSAARWPISSLDEVPSGGWTDEYKTDKLVLRYIPAGSFIMGGRATDYPGAVNTNLHMVTLTKPFYIGVFECTQRQWELAMGTRPSMMTNEQYYAVRPVEGISFNMIRGKNIGNEWPYSTAVDNESFVSIIRAKTGFLSFDLPSEAQWEYACRGGSATALNTGENLSSEIHSDEVDLVGRYYYNSGMAGNPVDWAAIAVRFGNSAPNEATSVVGAYAANSLGLFDMHGNILEWCLDRASVMRENLAIDPVGPDQEKGYRVVRGGSWIAPAYECTSSHYYVRGVHGGIQATYSSGSLGFRICLHDAIVYPSADSATVLVNASGAAAADWTPTRAGTYQLTHEVQVDGTTVAPMESAVFKVEGPELNIRPQGELTNGVEVAIEGASDWPVYYTTDGSTPTQASEHYEGPFAIPESVTVKAVAISAGGVSSEVASKELALHPALAVEDTKARQRYPWNGKVDIDCEVKGDAAKKYAVTFSVEDEIGHTNLPIRTVSPVDRVLSPGKYRFVWDAAADLPKGTKFGEVSVSIDAVPSPLADWKRVVTISTDGYAGNETLTDVPVLVRLSSATEGFDYNDFAAPDTGADMIFTDMEGVARYPYEIDEWHKDGESLVWVKLPQMANGTKFKMAYGNSKLITLNSQLAAHEVWRDYAGVWHMNEDSGTAYDSTAHGLDALPSKGTNELADISQMVAYENGACGRARVNANADITSGNYLMVPNYDALILDDTFVFSGWIKKNSDGHHSRFVSRKRLAWDGNDGWEISTGMQNFSVRAASADFLNCSSPDMGNWTMLCVKYSGNHVTAYTNGALAASATLDATATDNQMSLALGGFQGKDTSTSLNGQYDEIRLRGGSLSADRIKADYDMIAKHDFCMYGKVEAGPGADPVPPSVHSAVVTFNPNSGTLVGSSLVIYKGDAVVFGTMPTATKDGYSFRGWGHTADATEVVKSTDVVPDSGCELFAVWDEMTYTVKFNANGGTGTMADEEFTYGIAQSLTANVFKKDGCMFAGWATSATGGKVYDDKQSVSNLTTTPGGTVTLFAVWKEVLYMVIDLSGGSSAKSYPVSYLDAVPSGGWTTKHKGDLLVLRKVKKGTNKVAGSMSSDMWVGVFEVTQKQYQNVMGKNPSTYVGDYRPVEHAGYFACVDFMSRVSTKASDSTTLRMPTANEWRYACRAGSTAATYAVTKTTGRYYYNGGSLHQHAVVGSYSPNAWGLYDMLGNVWEWTSTGLSGTSSNYTTHRYGGSYNDEYEDVVTDAWAYQGGTSLGGDDEEGFRVFGVVE